MVKEEESEEVGAIFRDIRRYYCEYCGICRSKKSLITSHLLSHHKEEMEEKKGENEEEEKGKKSNYSCEECGISFRKPAHLKQHMLSHSFQRPFVCPVNDCNASYRRKDHLNRHTLQHQGKLFKCPIEKCDKEFTLHGNVNRHVKEFHKDKPEESDNGKRDHKHVCPEIGCGKEFKFASQLQKHAESHVLESSEIFCGDPSCMKPFSNVKCLRAHMRSCHQHVKCEICGSKHLRKNYKRHLQTHEDHLPTIIKCSFEGCDHSFTTKSNLQQHVKAVHLNMRPYMCSVSGCGMTFAFKHVRDNHEKSSCHVYVPGDLEEFDEQFRSRPRGGRKRKLSCIKRSCIEMLKRKRVTPPSHYDSVLSESSEFMLWCLSDSDI